MPGSRGSVPQTSDYFAGDPCAQQSKPSGSRSGSPERTGADGQGDADVGNGVLLQDDPYLRSPLKHPAATLSENGQRSSTALLSRGLNTPQRAHRDLSRNWLPPSRSPQRSVHSSPQPQVRATSSRNHGGFMSPQVAMNQMALQSAAARSSLRTP